MRERQSFLLSATQTWVGSWPVRRWKASAEVRQMTPLGISLATFASECCWLGYASASRHRPRASRVIAPSRSSSETVAAVISASSNSRSRIIPRLPSRERARSR